MDMNPFKPLVQHFKEFNEKILFLKKPIINLYLKLRLVKATT